MSKWNINGYVAKKEIQAQDALSVAGFWLSGQVKRLTPTITSRLKNSWSSAVKGESPRGANTSGGKVKAKQSELVPTPNRKLVAWIGSSVSYAPFVEFGTSKQKAQAPLRKAFEENKKQLMKFLAGRMRK